ncbi:hypothetical protein GGF46_003831 [Coemansia sp. RSA 552]|nr:hypothetical protein GGF46_003831 [Coemansia sp. RSA 552]
MQAVFRLILEGLAMFAGSWAAGCIPLYVKMSPSKFSIMALFGAGLLIGAALAVILTEGVETLTRAMLHRPREDMDELVESMNTTIGWSLVAGFCTMFLIDSLFPAHAASGEDHVRGADSATCLEEIPMASEFTVGGQRRHSMDDSLASPPDRRTGEQLPAGPEEEWRIEDKRLPQWRRILNQLIRALSPQHLPSTLIGILVHSCADGLALGAAVASSVGGHESEGHTSLEIIVFMALLLHKAPAAFGLITTLKQQGHPTYKLGIWLTVFAASAPLAALATLSVFLMVASPKEPHDEGVQPWAGVVMLYSAGTFLYVAMAHTLVEAVSHAKSLRAAAAGSRKTHAAALGFVDIGVLLLGVILPPLVSKDHDG